MNRYCFLLQVRPNMIDEYRLRHANVWPQLLQALADSGWHNYSLFLRPDGLLVGYVESEDLDSSLAAMAKTAVNSRWQADMQRFFVEADGQADGHRPDEGLLLLEEVFHLEDQLGTATRPPHSL